MKKIGILGGGQLGRMLLQAAANYPVETFVLETDAQCPSAHLCHHFVLGDIQNYDDVFDFGKGLDAITIEIESVNIFALENLEKRGVKVFPSVAALKTIKNKALQKKFYQTHEIPTSPFVITQSREELSNYLSMLPAAHKIAEGGYDGRGVSILENESDLKNGFEGEAVLEKKVSIKKEISVIVAVDQQGKSVLYPPVEMVFNPDLNLLDYQICPADLSENLLWKAEAVALAVVKNLKSAGIFAIELFVDEQDQVLVNETAPRVHNSGHHTIESCASSQFDMLWRIMMEYPLGNTDQYKPSALINLLGEKNQKGSAVYEGLADALSLENVHVHIYGKKETRPGRKMGHITILEESRLQLIYLTKKVKALIKVLAKENV